MIDKAFVAGYAIFVCVLWSALLLLLGRKLDARFTRPVLYGALFALITQFLFGAGIVGLFLGGVIAGYAVAGIAPSSLTRLRSGTLAGLIADASFLLAVALYLAANFPDVSTPFVGLCSTTLVLLVRDLLIAGLGAVVGGLLKTPSPK